MCFNRKSITHKLFEGKQRKLGNFYQKAQFMRNSKKNRENFKKVQKIIEENLSI